MFRIGKNFHIIHMTDDFQELDRWYDDVFSVHRYMGPSFAEVLKRDASLVLIGDFCIEPMAPAFRAEGWDDVPLGRFYRRFGQRWHSIAWYTEETGELYRRLRSAGIRMYGGTGVAQSVDEPVGPIFTYPGDTYTQLQFMPRPVRPQSRVAPEEYARGMVLADPRFMPGFNPAWWKDRHPLGILKSSHITLSVYEMSKATDLFVGLLGGEVLHEGEMSLTRTKSVFVALGEDLVLELATPSDSSSPLAADMETYHEGIYAVTFKVKDLDAAARYLESKGVAAANRDDSTLLTDPATTHGVVMGFTTLGIPNDRREEWFPYSLAEA
jgi:catechol 2,3-dioxygenase-like lactoylglutathione lyase family enzyme